MSDDSEAVFAPEADLINNQGDRTTFSLSRSTIAEWASRADDAIECGDETVQVPAVALLRLLDEVRFRRDAAYFGNRLEKRIARLEQRVIDQLRGYR